MSDKIYNSHTKRRHDTLIKISNTNILIKIQLMEQVNAYLIKYNHLLLSIIKITIILCRHDLLSALYQHLVLLNEPNINYKCRNVHVSIYTREIN